MSNKSLFHFIRNKKPTKTVHIISDLPSILNTNLQRKSTKQVSFAHSLFKDSVNYDLKICQTEPIGQKEIFKPHKRISGSLLKLNQLNSSDTPKLQSRIPSSINKLNKQIATLEKNIETINGTTDIKPKNKLVNLSDLVLPKLDDSIKITKRENTIFNSEPTIETEADENFVIQNTKSLNEGHKIRFNLYKSSKQKVNMNMTEYKTNGFMFFKNKKLKDIKVLVNKQYGSYMVKCNELKDYIQTRYESLSTIRYDK
jgi:hypothetical protein